MFSEPKILVCTDFSEESDMALRTAKDIAHKTKGVLYLLHVAELSFYLNLCGDLPELNEQFLSTINDDLIKLLHDQAIRCGVAAEVKVLIESDLIKGILKDQEELKADLIVVGGKKKKLGGNTRKICSISQVPVLVVKNDHKVERVAALVDMEKNPEELVEKGLAMSEMYGAPLTLISLLQQLPGLYSGNVLEYSSIVVNALRNESEIQLMRNRKRMQEILRGNDAKMMMITTFEKDLGHHLTEILDNEKIQLAIMNKHHRSLLERYFLGSVTSRVLELYQGNILVY